MWDKFLTRKEEHSLKKARFLHNFALKIPMHLSNFHGLFYQLWDGTFSHSFYQSIRLRMNFMKRPVSHFRQKMQFWLYSHKAVFNQPFLFAESPCSTFALPGDVLNVNIKYNSTAQSGKYSPTTVVRLSCNKGLFEDTNLPEIQCMKGNWTFTTSISTIPSCSE